MEALVLISPYLGTIEHMFDGPVMTMAQSVQALVSALSQSGHGATSDAERIDQLAALERLKAAVAAAQARVTAAFVDSQEQVAQAWRERARACSDAGDFEGWRAARAHARAASLTNDAANDAANEAAGDSGPRASFSGGRRRPRAMTGVAAQVALARRESPVRGAQHVRLALALTREMPHTLAALQAGLLSEWRAQIIVRETATLTAHQRGLVDAEVVAALGEGISGLSDKELARRVRAVAYRVDAASVMGRAARAESERRVTIRPAPDTMAYVTALLPVAQAVAAHAALTLAADAARAAGDERGKGQIMADAFVTRVTGQATAEAVPVEVQLVMTDRALLGGPDGADTPAQLPGYGTVPAAWARALLRPADRTGRDTDSRAAVWLRRLYTHPSTGALVSMDSTRRTFDGGLRRFLLTRDGGTCRTPWCEAPARHLDHVTEHADGGPTSADNGQGLCVRCNHTKQLPGWFARMIAPPGRARDPGARDTGARHTVETTTPTGHRYTSTAPPLLPGLATGAADDHLATDSPLERALALALAS